MNERKPEVTSDSDAETRDEHITALRYAFYDLKTTVDERKQSGATKIEVDFETPADRVHVVKHMLDLLNQGFEQREVRLLAALAVCVPVSDYPYHYPAMAGAEHFTGPDWSN